MLIIIVFCFIFGDHTRFEPLMMIESSRVVGCATPLGGHEPLQQINTWGVSAP